MKGLIRILKNIWIVISILFILWVTVSWAAVAINNSGLGPAGELAPWNYFRVMLESTALA